MTSASNSEAICVGVRLRPFVAYESGQRQCLTIRGNVVSTSAEVTGREPKEFAVDEAMDSMDPSSPSYVSQEKCYKLMAHRMVGHVLQGYNTCLFCYGQTGTGKTTTIMGKVEPVSEQGLLLRLLTDIFEEAQRLKRQGSATLLKVQMLEVYNEKVKDLLLPHGSNQKNHPDVHVHPKLGVYLKGVTEEAVESFEHCVRLVEYGNTMKTVAATAMNAKSSRAHTVFKLALEKRGGSDHLAMMSEVFFVDLAGRENEKTTKVTGERLVELTFINRSLMWLANCIHSLGAEGSTPRARSKKSLHANGFERRQTTFADSRRQDMSKFRNSKLTLLLSNALSGNSKTAMIGTLSPAVANFEESFSTLSFASTVKHIKVDARPASEVDKESLVVSLQEELRQLKDQLAKAYEERDASEIEEQLEGVSSLCDQYKKRWDDAHMDAKALMAQRESALEKLGVVRWNFAVEAVKMKNRKSKFSSAEEFLPYLANYSDDPHLSGRFMIHPAEVGREYCIGCSDGADFVVPHGLGVAPRTSFLRRDFGRLFIRAAEKSENNEASRGGVELVEVNGAGIGLEPVEVFHQDCVVLGRSLMFYAFTKLDGGIQTLPADKLRFSSVTAGLDSSDSLINEILGPERASDQEQHQLARKYYSQLQNQNLNAEGATSLHNFLLQARRAMKMVEEANLITASVRPSSGLHFELTSLGPVLAFGFGRSSLPEFCVRLVRQLPQARASHKLTIERMRRQSRFANLEMLQKFSMDGQCQSVEPETAKVDVLYTWTFPKFTARLQLMQDVHEAWTSDPEHFSLEDHPDPWSEFGPAEVAQMQQDMDDQLKEDHEEMRKLRMSCARDSHIVHSVLVGSKIEKPAEVELEKLRDSYQKLEMENAKLRNELKRRQAEFEAMLLGQARSLASAQLSKAPSSEAHQAVPVAAGSESAENASQQLRSCFELSNTNLRLVEDLFKLSISMLRAGAACLSRSTAATEASATLSREQGCLAEAAKGLVDYFKTTDGPLAKWAHESGELSTLTLGPPRCTSATQPRVIPSAAAQAACSGPARTRSPARTPGPARTPPMRVAHAARSAVQRTRSAPGSAAGSATVPIGVAALRPGTPVRSRYYAIAPTSTASTASGLSPTVTMQKLDAIMHMTPDRST